MPHLISQLWGLSFSLKNFTVYQLLFSLTNHNTFQLHSRSYTCLHSIVNFKVTPPPPPRSHQAPLWLFPLGGSLFLKLTNLKKTDTIPAVIIWKKNRKRYIFFSRSKSVSKWMATPMKYGAWEVHTLPQLKMGVKPSTVSALVLTHLKFLWVIDSHGKFQFSHRIHNIATFLEDMWVAKDNETCRELDSSLFLYWI